MRIARTLIGAVCCLAAIGDAAYGSQDTPYAGLDGRALKALSDEQIEDYVEGNGMGLALAAELNGYPGPKHVLELVDELHLDEAQVAEMESIFARMHAEAVALGGEIVARERALDEMFALGSIDPESLDVATEELGRLNGKLRGVHLVAHLAAADVLRPEQRDLYDQARGYDAGAVHDPSRHHQ